MASAGGILAVVLLSLLRLPAHAAAAASGCASETFANGVAFAACNDLPYFSSYLHWTYDSASRNLSIAFSAVPAASGGWVAWAINPTGDGMEGSQALLAFQQSSGTMVVKTYNITSTNSISESPIAFPTSGVSAKLTSDGRMQIFATLTLTPGLGPIVNNVWQVGSSVTSGKPDPHAFDAANLASKGQLNLVTGESSAASAGALTRKRNTHGILNAVSWGILLPTGIIFSRYLKKFKSLDPFWFYGHITCQISGYAIGVAGWSTGLQLGADSDGVTYSAHRNLGIALFTFCTLQLSALFLRPKKDHKYRFYWNIYHHSFGYSIIIMGIINIFKGMDILDVAQNWRTAYIVVIAFLGLVAAVLEAVTWALFFQKKKSEEKQFYDGGSTNGRRQPLSL